MRKLISGLLLAGLFVAALFSSGAAFAYEEPKPEGQVVQSFIGLAYFQVWKHSDGRWQDTNPSARDGPDKPGQVKTWKFKMPGSLEDLTAQWDLTGVRVRFLPADQWSETIYQDYKGYKGLSYDTFDKQILYFSAAKGQEGRVWAEEHFPDEWTYTLHYEDIRLATQPWEDNEELAKKDAMNLKVKENRLFVQSLGIPLALPAGVSLEEMAEGYIYWVPYIVEVYGIPKAQPPDFYVNSLSPGTGQTEPGQRYTATFKAGLKVGFPAPTPATVTAKHNGTVVPGYPQTLDFFPGGEASFSFTYTGQDGDSNLEVSIAPVGWDDADWSNNSAQATVPAGSVDLVAESLSVPASPITAGTFPVTASFRNAGNRAVNAVVEITQAVRGKAVTLARQELTFSPGQRRSVTAQAAVGAGDSTTIRATIDRDNLVKETDESNNSKAATVTGKDVSLPDLPPPESRPRLVPPGWTPPPDW